jgi:hypothetical protein
MLKTLVSDICLLWVLSTTNAALSQSQIAANSMPPSPYVDAGACPFEGCVYREWVTRDLVTLKKERAKDSPVAFTVGKGVHVQALTGVVVTTKPGRVQFRAAVDLAYDSGTLHIEPDQTLFLLTYQGEGYTKAWYKGLVYTGVDAASFFNAICDRDPSRCTGKIVEKPQSVWWVQIRNTRGQVGWTDETDKFDGKDALH